MSNALAKVPVRDMDAQSWHAMKDQAAMLVKSGFLPPAINTPEKAVALMLKGRELGVPAMYAISNIHVINGKPVCSAELMLALVQRDHGHDAIRVAETTNERCVIEYKQWGKVADYAFTIQDAATAGLTQKGGNWKAYPAAMLRARAISAVCRMAFPASIAGMYTPDELGAAVTVNHDGEVVAYDNMKSDEQPGGYENFATDGQLVDAEYVVEHDNIVDAETGEIVGPEPESSAPMIQSAHPDPLSDGQKKFIRDLQAEHGFSDQQMGRWLSKLYGVTAIEHLSKADARNLIDRMKALKGSGGGGK